MTARLRKLLVMGLPGAGKTCLARLAAARLGAVHFNADEVRAVVSPQLGFSREDRVEHARRMGWMCDRVVEAGGHAVADFVCPTKETRAAFFAMGPGTVVFVDRVASSRYPDTDALFEPPPDPDLHVLSHGSAHYWADRLCALVAPVFDPQAPTAFMLGRFQPFHAGHKALAGEAIRRHGQVCIAVRDTYGAPGSPYRFEEVRARIDRAMREHAGRYTVVALPNIVDVVYGRDVGYAISRIDLDPALQLVSATDLRRQAGLP